MSKELGVLPILNEEFGLFKGKLTVRVPCPCGLETCTSARVVYAPEDMNDTKDIGLLIGRNDLETCVPQTLAATAEKAGVTIEQLMHHIILYGDVADELTRTAEEAQKLGERINDLAKFVANQEPYEDIEVPDYLKGVNPPELLRDIFNPKYLSAAAKKLLAAAVLIEQVFEALGEHDPMTPIERAHKDALEKHLLENFVANLVNTLN